ncbi:MAG TPA: AarF/ABC1/UbiB kinase family protein [Pseudobdellovibrionaceae bacterium]|nr:AarF/ABC1/UbiB kinase family protein [Pseudobdellovibrionaceae bacterium]
MKSSPFARSLELAKLVARVGLKELGSGNVQSRLDQAVLIAKSLSQLKGAAMKAGQLLSLDLDSYFPPEAIEVLSQLQNAAVAHSYEEIQSVLQAELSPQKLDQLRGISKSPIGVASIGQVHKAKYNHKEVVLKIQYPGVAESIDSDLKILKTLAVSFCQMTGRKMNLDPLFEEFRKILNQEVDYSIEFNFQKIYQSHIHRLNNSALIKFRVPDVIEELSTKKVLAMSFESGLSLRSWMESSISKSQRHELGRSILDLYFHEFFEWGLVQTDPNWGNFLIDPQEEVLNLCLLDFGATKKYNRDFIKNYTQLLNLAAENDFKKLKEHSIEFGLIDPRESEAAFTAFREMLTVAIKPFFVKKTGSAYFDFSDPEHSQRSQTAAKALTRELIYSPPPYSIIFLHRKLAGVYSILKSLKVQMDISTYWQTMNELSAEKI